MRLSLELVLELHRLSLVEHGGLPGVRDEGLLQSAISTPFSGFGEDDFYPGVLAKAAALIRGIVQNHPFFDGNKRTGYLAMRYFLEVSGYMLTASSDQRYNFVVSIASGQMELEAIKTWLEKNTAIK